MAWYSLLVLLAGIAIVVYGADEAIKRLPTPTQRKQNNAIKTKGVVAIVVTTCAPTLVASTNKPELLRRYYYSTAPHTNTHHTSSSSSHPNQHTPTYHTRRKNHPLIPTQTPKPPKPKNRTVSQPKRGTRRNRANSSS